MSRPFYARMLRLRYLAPSGFLCFVFLEGAVALGFLLALAELVSWWGVLVLPIAVALMVKLNDAVTGALIRPVPEVVPLGMVPVAAPVPMQRPPAVHQPAVREYAGHPAGQWPGVQQSGGERAGVEGLDVWQPRRWESDARPALASPEIAQPGYDDASSGGGWTGEPGRSDGRSLPAVAEVEVTTVNGSPSTRQWMDQIDTGQRLRQSANRRYE
jgi:hypothetical protein